MSSPPDSNANEHTVPLPADCRLAAVEGLALTLSEALSASAVALDGSAVERIDTSGLQLLLVFQREATQRKVAWRWLGVSDAIIDAAATLGLTEALTIDTLASEPA